MRIALRYFASVREALGASEILELGEGATVATARETLIRQDETHAAALAPDKALRYALNRALCDATAPLADGDELAFFPPVTGG